MALTDIQATWNKSSTAIWLNGAVNTAPTGDATFVFRNVGFGPWPKANKPLNEYDHQSAGRPLRDANDYGLGIVRPSFQLRLPFSAKAYSFGLISLLQNKSGATDLAVIPYSDPQVKWFFGLVAGLGAADTSRQVYGCVVQKMTISIPPVDASGGNPTLTLDCIGAYGTRTVTSAGTTAINTDKPCLSSDWSFKIGGAAKKFAGAEISIENGADWSPHVGANADMLNLGPLVISGNVALAVSAASGDEWDAVNDAYEAGSSLDLEFDLLYASATHTLKIPAVFPEEPPEPSSQGAVAVSTIPFKGIYKDADEPGALLVGMTSSFTAWS